VTGSHSRMKELRLQLEAEGYEFTRAKNGHWRIFRPDMTGPVQAPFSPSTRNFAHKLRTRIRRKTRHG